MPHALVAGRLHPAGRKVLEEAPDLTATFVEEVSEESMHAHLGGADAVLLRTQRFGADALAMAPGLRIVSRHGVGYDTVDVEALSGRGVALAICGDVNSASVAEHAAMMLLASAKRALRADASVRHGPWSWREGLESQDLAGRNLLLIGYGRIGRRVSGLMAAFGMHLRAHDPVAESAGWPEGPAAPVGSLKEGLEWADAVSISVPRTDAPILGAQEFAAMKPGAIVVNTARGGVLDEAALMAALESGQVAAAGLDVFETEPVGENHPLGRFDQVILSPHIAGLTREGAERMAVGAARNIVDFFAGRIDASLVVNADRIDGLG